MTDVYHACVLIGANDVGNESPLDLFEEYCGARLTLNCMRPGGQPYDFTVGWTDRCREFAETFPSKIDEYEGLLTNNRIWKTRTVGVGVLPPEMALDYGLSGPLLRGSGINWDLRRARPYEAYADLEFDVPWPQNLLLSAASVLRRALRRPASA